MKKNPNKYLLLIIFSIILINLVSASDFISTWNTSATIHLPLESTGNYSFNVDWGDGTSDFITIWNQSEVTHNYPAQGVYNITINGTIIGFRFNDGRDKLKIIDIKQWGDLRLGNNGGYFYGCANLNSSATDALNLSGTTNLAYMFKGASSFNGNINNWDVSNVTDMRSMFYGATSFNQPLNNWDVSKVTDMREMFYGATSFNQPLNNWDVSKVTDMREMFYGATSFNSNIDGWNLSGNPSVYYMFYRATNFNQPLNNWDVSKITNMAYMFYRATSFNQSLNNWNVSKVTSMESMFRDAISFNGNISNWDTSSVTSMSYMFENATSFNQPINNWNVSKVTTMEYMFNKATSFNQPLNNWDVSNVRIFSSAYAGSGMFYGATSFNGNISNWNTSSAINMYQMFYGATSFNQPLNNWDVSKVTDMREMFYGATSFNQPLNNWDVSKVTRMSSMFQDATSFNQPLNNWDTSSVTYMDRMFYRATSFNQPLNNWDVSNVTGMNWMFYYATSFNQNLSNWNVSKVTDMRNMFHGVTLSTANYNSLLNSWSQLSLQSNVNFDAGNSKYSPSANSSRQYIINTYNWTITDGGLDLNGYLNITMLQPTGDININQYNFYKFLFNVSCINYDCGLINIFLDPISPGCDVANSNCTDICGGLFNSNPTGSWSYDTTSFGVPTCLINQGYLYGTATDFTCDLYSTPGNAASDCAVYSENGGTSFYFCPSYERIGRQVTASDCVSSEGASEFNNSIESVFNFSSDFFSGGGAKGLVNITQGAIPFWTNATSNPQTITLHTNESALVEFWVNASGNPSGPYEFYGYVVPNVSSSNRIYSQRINLTIFSSGADTTAPQITINSPLNTTYTYSNISFNVSTNEASQCNYSLDSGVTKYIMSSINSSSNTSFIAYQNLSNGNYVVNFYCEDNLGNLNNTESVSFSVNTTVPSSEGENQDSGSTGGGSEEEQLGHRNQDNDEDKEIPQDDTNQNGEEPIGTDTSQQNSKEHTFDKGGNEERFLGFDRVFDALGLEGLTKKQKIAIIVIPGFIISILIILLIVYLFLPRLRERV